MKFAMKTLLAVVLVLVAAAGVSAQAVGNWQHVHGRVQGVQGSQLTLKADDGRVVSVDMSQVSQSVQSAMTPNIGVTVTGFPGTSPNRFTARYIEQDQTGPASGTAAATSNTVIARILPLVPQFVGSAEFQNRAAGLQNKPRRGPALRLTALPRLPRPGAQRSGTGLLGEQPAPER